MIRLGKFRARIFLAPEGASGNGGGSTGNPAGQQGGAQQTQQGSEPEDPFAGLQLDDLDPDARKIIEKAQADRKALLEKAKTAEQLRSAEEIQRKNFQSRFDQSQAQLQKLQGAGPQISAEDQARMVQLTKFEKILTAKGVSPDNAKVQAEMMLDMMSEFGQTIRGQIGADIAPFAQATVSREANAAWLEANENDKVGAMQVPEIQTIVWGQVQEMVKHGQQVTAAVVENLVGMAHYKHLQAGGQQQQQQQSMPPQLPNMGRPPAYGGSPQRFSTPDPKAPRYALDTATDAALQTVFKTWEKDGVKAPGLHKK